MPKSTPPRSGRALIATIFLLLPLAGSGEPGDAATDLLFDTHIAYWTRQWPSAIAVGDLDGNGGADVLLTTNSYFVTVHLSAQDGLLQPPYSFDPFGGFGNAGSIRCTSLADVDDDGTLDILATWHPSDSFSSGRALVVPGHGDGTFGDPRSYNSLPSWSVFGRSRCAAAADFNEDGRTDVVATNPGLSDGDSRRDTIVVLLQRPDGSLQRQPEMEVTGGPTRILAEDFDGDGHVDVLTLNEGSHDLSLLSGRGDGSFSEPSTITPQQVHDHLLASDFDEDGVLDIALGASSVEILFGHGDGSFEQGGVYDGAAYPASLAVGDTDGDGLLDLAIASVVNAEVRILRGIGGGAFEPEGVYPGGYESGPVALVDVNGDGRDDVVAGGGSASLLYVHLASGESGLRAADPISSEPGPLGAIHAATDFDDDARVDLVVAGSQPGSIRLAFGDGTGRFVMADDVASGSPLFSVAVEDLDGDGLKDVVTLHSEGLSVLRGRPGGTLDPAVQVIAGARIGFFRAGDLDGDGVLDLVTRPINSEELHVHLGNGDATYQPPITALGSSRWGGLFIADLNGDSIPDLVDDRTWLAGRGDGSFEPPSEIADDAIVAVHDLDRDGLADLVVSNGVRLGRGDGTFDDAIGHPLELSPPEWRRIGRATVADLDGDGAADILTTVAHYAYAGLVLLRGNGDGTFRPPTAYGYDLPNGGVAGWIVVDVDGNTTPDIIVRPNTPDRSGWIAWNRSDPPPRPVIEIGRRGRFDLVPAHARGLIAVTLFGAADFDLDAVDEDSLRFGPGGAEPTRHPRARRRDVNRDGFDDLMLHFRNDEAAIAANDSEACLVGMLDDGRRFEACDDVVRRGRRRGDRCGRGHELAALVPAFVWAGRGVRRRRRVA